MLLGVLKALGNNACGGDVDNKLERLAQLTLLRAVMEALPGVSGDVFRSRGLATRSGRRWKRPRRVSPAKVPPIFTWSAARGRTSWTRRRIGYCDPLSIG